MYDETFDAPAYFVNGQQVLPVDIFDDTVEKVSNDERKKRIVICISCEKNEPVNCCSECGCWVSAKTWVKNANCPLNKW